MREHLFCRGDNSRLVERPTGMVNRPAAYLRPGHARSRSGSAPKGWSVSKRLELGPDAFHLRNKHAEGGYNLICLTPGPLVPKDYVESKADLDVHYSIGWVKGR